MNLGIVLAMAVTTAVLVVVLLIARNRNLSKEVEALRELGFATVEKLPDGILEAVKQLHAPKAETSTIVVTRALCKQSRAADFYFLQIAIPEEEESSYRQTMRCLHVYNPHWQLPEVAVTTLKDPERWADRMIGKALEINLAKRLTRLTLTGLGDFTRHATVFSKAGAGNAELDARRILSHHVQRALLTLPTNVMEANGRMLVVGRPAHTGKKPDYQQEWRELMNAARALAEEVGSIRASHAAALATTEESMAANGQASA